MGEYYEEPKRRGGSRPVDADEEKYGKWEVERAADTLDEHAKIVGDKKMMGFIKKYRAFKLKEAKAAAAKVGVVDRTAKRMKGVFNA